MYRTPFTSNFLLSLVDVVVTLVEASLALRIILKLFAASRTAPFVQWVYETTEPLLAPFSGMFPSPSVSGGMVLEFSALFALIVYAFVGYLITQIVTALVDFEFKTSKK